MPGDGTGLAVDGQYAYMTASRGFEVDYKPGTTGDTRLYIGRYVELVDTTGIAPTASITAPAQGEEVAEGTVTVTVAATDDVAVAAVGVVVDGRVVSIDTTAPYTFTLFVPTGISTLTLGALVVDVAGNFGTAAEVTVSVTRDPGTTIVGRIHDDMGHPVEGASVACADQLSLTASDGTFVVSDVPTVSGTILCTATYMTSTGQLQSGALAGVVPLAGGSIDIGIINLIAGVSSLFPVAKLPVGSYPLGLVIGDLNADGISDLATANSSSDDVSVILGRGNGTFAAEQRFPVGMVPVSLSMSDLDGDGILDLVTANLLSIDVSVLLGMGDGTFAAERRLSVGHTFSMAPDLATIGELNGDGIPDLVTGRFQSGVFSIWLGVGNGTFVFHADAAMGSSTTSALLQDLNTDEIPDLVTTRGISDELWVSLGLGDGTFTPRQGFAVGEHPVASALGDLNGDGIPDLVTVNALSDDVSVLLGMGDGTFAPEQRFGIEGLPSVVTVGDVNGDSIPDVVTANSTGDLSVLLGLGDGSLAAAQRYGMVHEPQAVVVQDMNDDGRPDVVTANPSSLTVLFGIQNGMLPGRRIPTDWSRSTLTVEDLNADGIPDLVIGGGSSSITDIVVRLGIGDGTFAAEQRTTVGRGPGKIIAADLNNDGIPDLITANAWSRDVSVLLGIGDGTFMTEQRLPTGNFHLSLAAGDLNVDGIPDLALVNSDADDISLLFGRGDGTFGTMQRYTVGAAPWSLVMSDLNRDGNPDLAIVHSSSDEVSVLLNIGDGTFGAVQRYTVGDPSESLGVGDFNSDGVLDLVTSNNLELSVLLGRNDGSFDTARRYQAAVPGIEFVLVGDLNADDIPDLITAHFFSDVSVLFGRGDGSFTTAEEIPVGGCSESVAIADFNGDGRSDLATVNSCSADASILLQR